MNSPTHHTYDFNYSTHFEPATFQPPSLHPPPLQHKDFSIAAHQLCEYNMVKRLEVEQFYMVLMKQSSFIRLGKQVQELVEMEWQLSGKKNMRDMDKLYFLREEICDTIKEMNAILGRDREHYINLIVLFLAIILLRTIHKRHHVQMQKAVLFHFVHWEIKGQHSTDIAYQTLLDDLINADTLQLYAKRVPIIVEPVSQSLTFKQIQSSINLKRSTSIVSSFAVAFNKQNHSLNRQYKPVLKNFKKGGVGEGGSGKGKTFWECSLSK